MTDWLNKTHIGDCRELLRRMADDGVQAQTCVTSPPYFGLRDYGCVGQIGLEPTPDEYVAALVAVFAEVRRVLRDDGTVWLNLGDSYNSQPGQRKPTDKVGKKQETNTGSNSIGSRCVEGVKPKDMLGIPWRVAFALQADGWYLRSDIIWAKPNPMPESVTDRPTKAHEYLFLLAKSQRYYYDAAAIAEVAESLGLNGGKYCPPGQPPHGNARSGNKERKTAAGSIGQRPADHLGSCVPWEGSTRNRRTVWTVATQPFSGAHFATFPPALIEPCVLAGAPAGGVVLDPFMGSGTTGQVATNLGRQFIGCELNPAYVELHEMRRTTIGLPL